MNETAEPDIVQTVREIRGRRGFRFRREAVVGIDLAARRVHLASASLEYDALVIALGSQSNYFGIPGAENYSFPFKTVMDDEARGFMFKHLARAAA